ncbi:hypothetical protein COM99_26430 [Bacillus cereus]|uniref:hypothetical protein n=1 Tax=Bacillus cereus TaxID=1396 RepID=UPI000BEBACD8|nr:hypothetical protein [Bacillus cereus]MDF3554661.1 hypothetical protein [Bacillus cereus]PEC30697.1 hypothetical protein COM99_26430 [Bacillus cereus]PEY41081.1 hypothetical protein CN347_01850 [Bacillus cereus]PFJ73692.1 hypothetical protein COJ08_24130 [Bacillus cereus]PFP18919.1 hypothetical protein COJ94_29045 [Bacillus cereus]
MIKLSRKKYPEAYRLLEKLKRNANYNVKFNIYIDYTEQKVLSGFAASKHSIFLTYKVLKIYPNEPTVLKSLLSHEFAHVINGDLICQNLKDKKYDIHTTRLINIIKEIRAEIVGANLAQLSPKEINSAQNIMMKVNENKRIIKESYLLKYPTRVQIKYFAKRYSDLTSDIIYYFIKSYFKHMKITDKTTKETIQKDIEARFSDYL